MWITVKKVSELLRISERAVRMNCQNNKYEYRCINGVGRGGKQYEILLESLPDEAQAKYYDNSEFHKKKNERPPNCTAKQWQEAERKARIVLEYQSSNLSVDDFIKWHNENYDCEPLNRHKLFTYQKKYKNGGTSALLDNRGGARKGVDITEEMWEYFYSLYMTQQKRTIRLCYDKTKDKFGEPFPSISSFERKVRNIDNYALIYYREGEHAFKDALPCMQRDKSSINSNDIWFSDHRHVDVFAKNAQGKIYRPWITVFFDARSNKIISHIVREDDPNAIVIKQCLKQGILTYGVPKEIYFDNGKDYRSNQFNKDYPFSIVRQLGINCIYAHPYHGQAKTVERFFGIMADRFDKLFPTYTGKDNKNRPQQMRVSNKKLLKSHLLQRNLTII